MHRQRNDRYCTPPLEAHELGFTFSVDPETIIQLKARVWWAERFSSWEKWIAAIQALIEAEGGVDGFVQKYIMRPSPRGKTCAVFGTGAQGWLPHPSGPNQARIMEQALVDGEVSSICLEKTLSGPRERPAPKHSSNCVLHRPLEE